MARVRFDNIWKEYPGGEIALRGLSFETDDQEFLVILGPAGAGKTTTLKIAAGLERPTAGRVFIDGKDVTYQPANKRNVAMTFEDYALFPQFTVFENLANPLHAPGRSYSKQEIRQRVEEVARMLQIDGLLNRAVDQLSGGQKQRVSLGRSMVREPAVFLFDEPLSHVDAKVRHAMRAELHRLESVLNTSSIYVTHDYLEALSLGDRVLVLNDGQLEQVGTPYEIYHQPANRFVAAIVGQPEINLVECRVQQENGAVCLNASAGGISLRTTNDVAQKLRDRVGSIVDVGIRPQNVSYSLSKQDQDQIAGRTVVFESWGTKGMLLVELGNIRLALLTAPELDVEAHQPVWLDIDESKLYVFDKETGDNILLAKT